MMTMAKGVLHAGKKLGLSSGNADENERKKNDRERKGEKKAWDEETYRKKNKIPWNNYDWSRHSLNFEIARGKDGKPKVIPLGSQDVTLYRRYQKVLQEIGFKQYKIGASNQQLTYMEIILSGSTEKMQKLAFGDQKVDFTRNPKEWKNWGVTRTKEIEQWALECYDFICKKYGAENIIGFEVHLDETEPHIHVNIVPTAIMQQRGRNGGYHKVDIYGNPVTYTKGKHVGEVIKISESKYNALSEEKKAEYRPNVRGTVRTISYAYHFGGNKPERSAKMSQLHDEFYVNVGRKWGFARGDVWAKLPEEERRKRKRRTKEQAYEEEEARKAKEKVLDETNAATEKLKAVENELETTEKDLKAAQKDLRLIKKVKNLVEENVGDYIHALPDVEISVTKDIRAKLVSSMREHTRILTSVNPPMSIYELARVMEEELEAVIKDKGLFLSKKDRNKRMRDIITDMTTIMIDAAGGKQTKEIANIGRKLYISIRSEMADAISKAIKYDCLEKEGLADVNLAKELRETASRTKATEDMLEFSWPGVTKAKDVLIEPELDNRYMSKEQRNEVLNILRDDDKHPEDRIADMLQLLKYACSFRNIPLATQVEALMLSTDKAIKYIKDNIECDFLGGAKNMVATIGEQFDIEKPAEAINQIASTAACLFFGFVDAATTISVGGGGGDGQDTGGWRGKGDDENNRDFAARCLFGAAQMRLPHSKKIGQSR